MVYVLKVQDRLDLLSEHLVVELYLHDLDLFKELELAFIEVVGEVVVELAQLVADQVSLDDVLEFLVGLGGNDQGHLDLGCGPVLKGRIGF